MAPAVSNAPAAPVDNNSSVSVDVTLTFAPQAADGTIITTAVTHQWTGYDAAKTLAVGAEPLAATLGIVGGALDTTANEATIGTITVSLTRTPS